MGTAIKLFRGNKDSGPKSGNCNIGYYQIKPGQEPEHFASTSHDVRVYQISRFGK